jgi:hypothetical protein
LGSYFEASQIHDVSAKIKIHHSDPSMDRSIKIVRQFEQDFEPYRVMFKELKEKKRVAPITMFLQRKEKTLKNTRGRSIIRGLSFSTEGLGT